MNQEVIEAVLNTLAVCGLTILLAVPVGATLAILLARTNVLGRRWAWLFLCSQLALPLYAFAGAWCAGFGTQGWFTVFLSRLWSPSNSAGNVFSVAAIHAAAAAPQVALVCAVGLTWANRSEEEAAIVEGGLALWLRQVVSRRLAPWLLASAGVCCFPVLTEMVVTNLYRVPSVAELVYLDASLGTISPRTYIVAGGLGAFPLVLVGILLWWRLAKIQGLQPQAQFAAQPVDLCRLRWACSIATWLLIGFLVLLPAASLVAKAGWTPALTANGDASYSWTWARFVQTVREAFSLFSQEYYWSAIIAFCSASLATIIAAATWAIPPNARIARWCVGLLMVTAMCIPGPLVGMLVIAIMNRDFAGLGFLYDHTITAVVLAQMFRLAPLAVGFLGVLSLTIPASVREEMQLDDLSMFGRLRCLWPTLWKQLVAVWALLGVLSVGELSASILVLPPGVATVSMRLFEMLHFGMRHQDSALCGVLVLLGGLVGVLVTKTLSARQ